MGLSGLYGALDDIKMTLEMGIKGETGEKGDKGDKGETGEKGDKGDKGETGVYIGAGTPPDDTNVWINPTGEPTSTEEWAFRLSDGTTDTKTVVVLNSDEAEETGELGILRVKDADGNWMEIPAIKGDRGDDGETIGVESVVESEEDGGINVVTFSDGHTVTIRNGSKGSPGEDGKDGADGADGHTPAPGIDYWTEADKAGIIMAAVSEVQEQGYVRSVNGLEPDETGNVEVQAGVQSDWNQNDAAEQNYVKNRTHYCIPAETIRFNADGSTATVAGATLRLCSDRVLTADELIGSTLTVDGEEHTITSENVAESATGGYPLFVRLSTSATEVVLAVSKGMAYGARQDIAAGTPVETTYSFFKKGVYLAGENVTANIREVYVPLDENYLPAGIVKSVNSIPPDENGNVDVDPTPDDALELLDETGVACAIADEGGAVLTDDADNILIY